MTAPEPTVCWRCEGSTVESMRWVGGRHFALVPCRDCTCEICGKATDTPPVCVTCDADEDSRQRRRADV